MDEEMEEMMRVMEEDMQESMGFLKVAHEGRAEQVSRHMSHEQSLSAAGLTLKVGLSGAATSQKMEENAQELSQVSLELFNLLTSDHSEHHQNRIAKLLEIVRNLDDFVVAESPDKAYNICGQVYSLASQEQKLVQLQDRTLPLQCHK